jgi:hypothetical protein
MCFSHRNGRNSNGTVFVADTLNNAIRSRVPLIATIQAVKRETGMLALTWDVIVGQTYQVQFNTDLLQGDWNNLSATRLRQPPRI